jgi:hypothetical protein
VSNRFLVRSVSEKGHWRDGTFWHPTPVEVESISDALLRDPRIHIELVGETVQAAIDEVAPRKGNKRGGR